MKKLSEHNNNQTESYITYNPNAPVKNGIACDNCGEELFDSTPMMTLTSNPPKKEVHCNKCGFQGYRIA